MKIAYNLDVLCRLCLNQLGKDNIFKPIDMTNDIFTITGVKVVQNDPLPQTICIKCIKTIKDAIQLRFVSKNNDRHLKYLLFNENDYNFDCEITINHMPLQSQILSKSNSDGHNTLLNINNGLPTNSNEESNTSNQILKVREDLYSQSMIENNDESRKQCTEDNGDKSTIVKEEDEEYANEGERSLLVPIKKRRSSGCEEGQLFSYECEKCFKIFDTRKKLTLHARIHKKKCRCPHEGCDKTFACNNDLYKHIRCHTGERPYQCDICLRTFTQNGTLRSHKLSIHGIQMNINRGSRFKLEGQFGSFLPPSHLQSYDAPKLENYGISVDTQIQEYTPVDESKVLVTSNMYDESMNTMDNEASETQLQVQMSTDSQVQLSTENTHLDVQLTPETILTNGQEIDSNIISSNMVRLPEPDVESLEPSCSIESTYFQPELCKDSTPNPTTSMTS